MAATLATFPLLTVGSVVATAVDDVERVARTHGIWMTWNMLLATIPLMLAIVLFNGTRRRTWVWWTGLGAFVLFLPNAPYILTDVIHLFDDIRVARSDLQVLAVYLPIYLLLFALSFGLYVAALDQLHRYVRRELPSQPWWPIEASLHLLCAIGIYLGRVVRLNSWDVFTRPHLVLAETDRLPGLFPITLIALTAVVLAAGTLLARVFVRGTVDLVRSWRDARGGPEPA